MTILGMKLATVKISALLTAPKNYYVSAIKLIACPAVIVSLLLLTKIFFGNTVDNDFIIGFFVAFSMPTAALASTFADTFDGDTNGAVIYTLGTTVLSIVTIPALFGILSLLI